MSNLLLKLKLFMRKLNKIYPSDDESKNDRLIKLLDKRKVDINKEFIDQISILDTQKKTLIDGLSECKLTIHLKIKELSAQKMKRLNDENSKKQNDIKKYDDLLHLCTKWDSDQVQADALEILKSEIVHYDLSDITDESIKEQSCLLINETLYSIDLKIKAYEL